MRFAACVADEKPDAVVMTGDLTMRALTDALTHAAARSIETPATLARKIDGIAEFSELGEFLDLPIRYYSGGMLIRLAFSIATAVDAVKLGQEGAV